MDSGWCIRPSEVTEQAGWEQTLEKFSRDIDNSIQQSFGSEALGNPDLRLAFLIEALSIRWESFEEACRDSEMERYRTSSWDRDSGFRMPSPLGDPIGACGYNFVELLEATISEARKLPRIKTIVPKLALLEAMQQKVADLPYFNVLPRIPLRMLLKSLLAETELVVPSVTKKKSKRSNVPTATQLKRGFELLAQAPTQSWKRDGAAKYLRDHGLGIATDRVAPLVEAYEESIRN